ncbi:hypothetical protein, partial [Mesorhizobium sp.]|uniref:hypothetical protein n=1 Tax=Mesorhizobium sp. TaxID=1871066 RepID=UPI0025B89BFF
LPRRQHRSLGAGMSCEDGKLCRGGCFGEITELPNRLVRNFLFLQIGLNLSKFSGFCQLH